MGQRLKRTPEFGKFLSLEGAEVRGTGSEGWGEGVGGGAEAVGPG